jgi:hypothetical protein
MARANGMPGDSASGEWGEGLAYPEWIAGFLPAVHEGFTAVNKRMSVPALKMGLGRYMSNLLTGYLPLVRVRATGIAAGPEDPGGRYRLVPMVGGTTQTLAWPRSRRRRRARARNEA